MSRFKVGDKVKYNGPGDDIIPYGEEGTITKIDTYTIEVLFPNFLAEKCKFKDTWTVDDFSLDKIEEDKPKKYDSDKPRMDLIRPEFTLALGEALAYGAKKYEEPRGDIPNYLKGDGFNYSTIIGSLERHIAAFKSGQDLDEESGLNHLAHAAINLMFLHTYTISDKGVDDRYILDKKDD